MIPLDDPNTTSKAPFWTIVFIIINALVFFYQIQLSETQLENFIYQYALVPSDVNLNNFETLIPFITSQFLHGGWLHIISNMLFLWVFGDNVEERFGFLLFPIIYLLSGVVGGFSQYILSPDSTIPMLGASGAVAGVLGAYLVYFPHHSIKTLVPIFGFFSIMNIPATMMLGYWFITQLFAGAFSITDLNSGGVAYLAHIGGFVTGFIFAKIVPTSGPSYQRLDPA